jgi:hypothetical protein
MRLSGVDPGIIRELSGIYKPFVKAFKELVSNAYDADAGTITVTLHEDFSTLEVLDDGHGMTAFGFHEDFARLGGSTAWLRGGKSPRGRPRIGYKGIGFLAVARYCSALEVDSYSVRPHKLSRTVARRNRKTLPFEELLGDVIPPALLTKKISVHSVRVGTSGGPVELKEGRDYYVRSDGLQLVSKRALARGSQYTVDLEIDCRHLRLEAALNFDYLLGLERRADLRLLEDFCSMKLIDAEPKMAPYTRVRLRNLKDFVVRDLASSQVKGKARNIVFKSGREQFVWRLARASPIKDAIPTSNLPAAVRPIHETQHAADLPQLIVNWPGQPPERLSRPIYLPTKGASALDESVIPVDIDEGGLRVIGYLLARSEVIYPAELRGISIRVRNVAIGDSSFLGWENILSGPRKAAMSQITGELVVLRGLDASDAINPGRESFYEENAHYRILKRVLIGSEETIGGLVGKAISSILDRIRVRSQVNDAIAEAKTRRSTFADISSAVAYYGKLDGTASRLTRFFSEPTRANGLALAREIPVRPSHKIAGFEVENRKDLGAEVFIDFKARRIVMDFQRDIWNTSVYLGGHYYDVVLKQGKPEHPLCEFDNERRKIYVNWAHPVKLHMDDGSFLRSAILFRLAHYAVPDDANGMMALAMNMMSFRVE